MSFVIFTQIAFSEAFSTSVSFVGRGPAFFGKTDLADKSVRQSKRQPNHILDLKMKIIIPIAIVALAAVLLLNIKIPGNPISVNQPDNTQTGSHVSVGGLTFHQDFGSAMTEARNTGKPIVTVFSATWCPPCQSMKKDVYPSATVAPYHNQFVWAYLDADNPQNRSIMSQNGVQGIPHIAFISANGEKIGDTVGAMDAREFAGVLDNILNRS